MAGQAEPGRLIGGRYRLLSRLGAGGMGRVWRATDEALRIEVAVKEVWLPAAPGPESEDRLRRAEREARNAARLRDHPNVVAVHDVVVEDGVPWTVMQLVAGHTLEEHVAQAGPLSVPHAAIVAAGLLDALEAAHAAGIVHRDVKPANVMLADDGKVLLTDFGIAIGTTDTALTQAGTFLGSVEYIAPERARGTEGLAASDLFSLGVTLFQAVEGFSPFHRETATGTLTAVILDEAPAPVRAGRLTGLVTGLLEKDPAARVGIAEARELLTVREAPTGATAVMGTGAGLVVDAAMGTGNGLAADPGAGTGPGTGTGTGTAMQAGSQQRGQSQSYASGRGTAGAPLASPNGSLASPGVSRGPGTSSGTVPPRGSGALPPRRPADTGSTGHTGATGSTGRRPSQGTDQRRRVPAPEHSDRRRQPPIAEPRRATGPNQRPPLPGPGPRSHAPHAPAVPARRRSGLRPRAVILLLLVGATIAAVLVTVLHRSSFDVTGVKTGAFVKVDSSGHITGYLPEAKARTSSDGRRVTAREDRADADVCKRLHAIGRPDVEQSSSVSFCLVRPVEEAATPAQ